MEANFVFMTKVGKSFKLNIVGVDDLEAWIPILKIMGRAHAINTGLMTEDDEIVSVSKLSASQPSA